MTSQPKSNQRKLLKRETWHWAALAALLAGVVVLATVTARTSAASATFSFTPSSGSYNIGDTITTAIYENSGSDSVSGVQADFTYPQNLLQFVSINSSGTNFSVYSPSNGGGNGVVSVGAAATGVSNSQLLATVSFKVLASGTAALTFDPVCQTSSTNCIVANEVVNSTPTNIASASSGASFTLSTPVSTTPPTSTPPSSSSGSGSSGSTSTSTSSKPTTTSTSSTSSTSSTTHSNAYVPPNSTQPVPVSNNGQVQVSQPVTIEPATIQEEGVKEVDYYLNKKLVYVSKTAPYAYHIDTKHLLNGTYSLTSKTLYTTGRTSTSTQKIDVANPLSAEQIWLFIKHYLLAPIIIILAALVVWRSFIHLKRMWGSGGDNSSTLDGGSSGSSLNQQPEPSVIRPTTMVSQAQTIEVTSEDGQTA